MVDPSGMNTELRCPRCNRLIDPHLLNCSYCGVNLALAAALIENSVPQPYLSFNTPITPEVLVPRLGDYLIEKGVLNQAELQRALAYQRNKAEQGQPCLIGQALLELGSIDRSTLDKAVTEQILQLQTALEKTNQRLEQRVQERTSELQRALKKLTELNQLKSNFISNISHELRTPLTHIKGYLDMLSDGGLGPLTEYQLEAVQVLMRSENRLERLIEDLIQFSLATKGELSMKIESFDLDDVISAAVTQTANKAEAKAIQLNFETSPQHSRVSGDEEKIGWVLMQLLDNAIKFTPEGGQVVIEATPENGLLSVAVKDTGVGIPEERLDEAFEPFHQLDGSITRKYSGTGLGLAMVRRILDAHGVPIHVHSENGGGSVFEFSLPLDEDEL